MISPNAFSSILSEAADKAGIALGTISLEKGQVQR
jgi:hypothetical protein